MAEGGLRLNWPWRGPGSSGRAPGLIGALALGSLLVGVSASSVLARSTAAKPLPLSASCPGISVYPSPNTRTASPTTQISFRNVSPNLISGGEVTVTGSSSGSHSGRWVADSDQRGASFYPAQPFKAGETVTVTTPLSVCGTTGEDFNFEVASPPGPLAKAPAATPTPTPKLVQPTITYASQPGVKVPKLEIKKASNLGGEYIFEAPKGGTKLGGPMILNAKGQQVWFEALPPEVSASDVRVQSYEGKPALTWWKGTITQGLGYGEDVIMNSSYQVVATVKAGNGYQADLHEFQLSDSGTTAWVTAASTIGWNLKPEGGPEDGAVVDGIVQEIDIATGNVLREWHSLDHVAPSLSSIAYADTSPYDYFHVNGIDPLSSGVAIISSRNTDAVYALNEATGKVLWSLGGKHSSFTMGKGTKFALQHNPQLHGKDTLSLFDDEDAGPSSTPARAIVLHLNYKTRHVTLERSYSHQGLVVPAQGNIQLLANGDAFIGWGSGNYTSEYSKSGRLLFDATYGASVNSYRAFLDTWKGTPATPPSVVASAKDGHVTAYVSWNGTTETASWELLGGPSASSLTTLATARKSGFQTTIRLTTDPAFLEVVAMSARGKALGTSAVISPSA